MENIQIALNMQAVDPNRFLLLSFKIFSKRAE
jgi:hypothetical protein